MNTLIEELALNGKNVNEIVAAVYQQAPFKTKEEFDAVKLAAEKAIEVAINDPFFVEPVAEAAVPVAEPEVVAPISRYRMVAYAALSRGEGRVLPIAVGGKQPLVKWKDSPIDVMPDSEWAEQAPAWIEQIAAQFPDANACVIAKPGTVLFIDEDASKEFRAGYEAWSGEKFPQTYATSARENRLQSHWLQTDKTRALGNVPQGGTSADISVRQHNLYVLAEGSQHKNGVDFYKSVGGADILPMPDRLVEYLESIRVKSEGGKAEPVRNSSGLIDHGDIHGYLLAEAGRMRAAGLNAEEIEPALLRRAHENCQPPLDDSKIKAMAKSICGFPEGQPPIIFNQKPDAPAVVEVPEAPESSAYPVFPEWVMKGTSIYEGLVKPVCDANPSRIPYFMWAPATAILLNYLAVNLKIKGLAGSRPFKGSIYAVIIGKRGQTMKSSSGTDAMNYFTYMGVLSHASRDMKNAEGKIITWTSGSMEGLGVSMQRADCKHALLYYDELETLVNKAKIDGSTMKSQMLTVHESGKFENGIKSTKESFSLAPDTYCVSVIANTTVKKFPTWWSRLTDSDAGFDDRFVFIVQPETLSEFSMQQAVNFAPGALETRKLIDKALNQAEFAYEEGEALSELIQEIGRLGNRYANRVEKWAVAFAVDLGKTFIDVDCVRRAIALVHYEIAVKKFFSVQAAHTKEAGVQQEIRRALEKQPKMAMPTRELERICRAHKYGTSLWGQAYVGLIRASIVRQTGTGTKGDPFITQALQILPRQEDEDDE